MSNMKRIGYNKKFVVHPITEIICGSGRSLTSLPLYCPDKRLVRQPRTEPSQECGYLQTHLPLFQRLFWVGSAEYIEVVVMAVCFLMLLKVAYRADCLARRDRGRKCLSPTGS
jgi:hypothetical protein